MCGREERWEGVLTKGLSEQVVCGALEEEKSK